MRAGFIHFDFSARGGRDLVTILMMKCLERLGGKTILLCGRGVDKKTIMKYFKVDIKIDKELVFPLWAHNPVKVYFDFVLPSILRPFCDVVIDAYTSDLLPWVDVTYVHYPRPLYILEAQKRSAKNHWDSYYRLYQVLEYALSFRFSDRLVLANSCFTAEVVRKVFNTNPIVIYPPVNLTNSKSKITKKNLILTVGRISPEKKLEQIPLVAKRVDANFVILGSLTKYNYEYYCRIRRLIKKYNVEDKVTLIKNAPFSVKMELLQKAKVYFHTRPFEHFGIAIVEGMGAGCIPVVHDSGGPKEIVPEEWRYENLEEAIQKIKEALHSWSSSVSKDMKTIAHQFREERFQKEFSAALQSYLNIKKVV